MRIKPCVYDVIIVGAGLGGMVAAIESGKKGLRTLLLEKKDKPGKKLLVSGGGQCNITNTIPLGQFLSYYYEKDKFAGKSIRKYNPDFLCKWFLDIGIPLKTRDDGKVFPESGEASELLEGLINQINLLQVELRVSAPVHHAEKLEGLFVADSESQTFIGKKLIIATGGLSYPALGSSGDGFQMAISFGHRISEPRPALTSIQVYPHLLEELTGVSLKQAHLQHWRQNKIVGDYKGDLLITHNGVSGPVILNYSRYFEDDDVLTLNLAAPMKPDIYANMLLNSVSEFGKKQVKNILYSEQIPKRLIDLILHTANVSKDQRCAELTKEQRKEIVRLMTAFPLKIRRVKGFKEAMVTSGGVETEEVDGKTMESKLVSGLYFVGEVMDVDGMTGGFNLQFAFSSGMAAAKSI